MKSNFRKYVRAKLRRLGPSTNAESRFFAEWWVHVMKLALLADQGVQGNKVGQHEDPKLIELLRSLLALLNGDWRIDGVLLHHCQDRCDTSLLAPVLAAWGWHSLAKDCFV